MCFSASASITAAAFLIPTGGYAIYSSLELKRYHYLLLACVPVFFGIQQLIEGGVWLALAADNTSYIHLFSLGFVFFSHFFWPFWIPLSIYVISKKQRCKRSWVMLLITIIGAVLGLISYLPMLMNAYSIQTHMCANSIQYNTHTILDALINTHVGKYIYIGIIILPALISRDWAVKLFGGLIFLSVLATYLFYSYAFNSVWCFFSAIISIYIIYIIRRTKKDGLNFNIS